MVDQDNCEGQHSKRDILVRVSLTAVNDAVGLLKGLKEILLPSSWSQRYGLKIEASSPQISGILAIT